MKGLNIPEYRRDMFATPEGLAELGAPNSFVSMSPSAFMTDDVWDENIEKLAKMIRALPSIKDMPDWWITLHLDGCKSHVNTVHAQRIFRRYKIIVVKENSQSSHINQGFDKDPAKESKSSTRRWYALCVIYCPNLTPSLTS
jgi:hypothetical protein